MKTTSLELSKKLKEAGAKQDSELVFHKGEEESDHAFWVSDRVTYGNRPGEICYGTFDCHELLEGLPDTTHVAKCGDRYEADAMDVFVPLKMSTDATTPAEALGKLKLWCLQNGHCKE